MKLRHLIAAAAVCIPMLFLCSCASGNPEDAERSAPATPFCNAGWDDTVDSVMAEEGEDYQTYPSVYGGTTYTYPKEYLEKSGTVKYMFDAEDRLMSIAWAYGSDNTAELHLLYDTINENVNETYGASTYNADNSNSVGNFGNVWHREDGDIILSTMITSETKALQYSYLHPSVSNKEALAQSEGTD